MSEEEIFYQARALRDVEERAAYLDRACGDDAALRASVEALLQADVGATGFMERPQTDPDATVDGPIGERPGAVIGPYKLLQVIGEGGMGTVFMAEQTEPVRRKVALKLVRPGMDSRQILARFEAERQALAMMDHSNIAKVLDAGTTPTGGPYFVMELVKGVPITEYCDQNHLSPRERLELFVPVCQAIQHAHQKGIVHRDLKPSNVLVARYDDRPVPKVIDFGVAKATGRQLTERTLFTQLGQLVGTLEYMSPEQAAFNALDIDTRSDIYSLGVLLYELLTGSTPFERKRLRTAAFDEVLRIIREEEPPRPSTRLSESKESLPSVSARRQTEPAKLTRLVRGELDWIVMKALAKERERRYASAVGLADDIERHLDHEPVSAGPPSAAYRLRKFVRRNRTQVAAAGLVLLALALGVVGLSAVLAAQTRAKADIARALASETKANAALAAANARVAQRYALAMEAIQTFHTGVSEDFLLKEETFKELRDRLLGSAAGFYGKLGALLGQESDVASRRALHQANFELADLTAMVGRPEAALAAHRAVLAARRALAAELAADEGVRIEVGRSQRAVAALLHSTGRLAEAEAQYREALAIYAKLAAENPATDFRSSLASSHSSVGYLLSTTGQPAEAEAQYREALAIYAKLAAENPAVTGFRAGHAQSHSLLARLLVDTGRPKEAEAESREALALLRKLADDHPAVPGFRGSLAESHRSLGNMLSNTGRPAEAEAQYLQMTAIYQKLADDQPAVPGFRERLANSHAHLGSLLHQTGRPAEAEAQYRQALAIYAKLAADHPAVIRHRHLLADTHVGLGWLLMQMGRSAEAEAQYLAALPIWDKLAADHPKDPSHRDMAANTRNNLSVALRRLDRHAEARALGERAVAIREELVREIPRVPAYRAGLAENLLNRGLARRDAGDPAGAAADLRRAVGVFESLPSPTGENLFIFACIRAALAGLVDRAGSEVSAVEAASEAETAMALLHRAVGMGYRLPDAYRTEDALDPLRGRDDFRMLMRYLAMPAEPFARPR
jgi:eukaryotic-like serine/threonine-protein kinase